MLECLVFEVADGELDGGVVAVVDVGGEHRDGAVGREGVVAPVGPELGLVADESGAADDQPPVPKLGFRELRLAGVGVVGDRDPVLF